jgi:hypothetical protein
MKNILLCILLATGAFHAAGTALAQDSRKTAVEIWNDAIEKAAKAGGFIKDYGESRVVHRGAKPEVILRGDQLTFNGQQLKIGQSIDACPASDGVKVVSGLGAASGTILVCKPYWTSAIPAR